MRKAVIPIVVVIIAVILFYIAKRVFGWTLGIRTYWPAFIVLFLYTYYLMSIHETDKADTSS